MTSKHYAPFGTWKSTISARDVSAAQNQTGETENILIDPITSDVYIVETRPQENGRSAIVSLSDGKDIFGSEWDARSRVHEYGGAAAVVFNGVVYFSHFKDSRVYKCAPGLAPVAVTPVSDVYRYACFTVHPEFPEFIVCTREDHTDPHPAKVITDLCLINVQEGSVSSLVNGLDFYAYATFSPSGGHLAWQQWSHPDLPWQSARIAICSCALAPSSHSLSVGPIKEVGGKHGEVVALEPHWLTNDTVVFVCDVDGYLNPWKFEFDSTKTDITGKSSAISPSLIEEEFGEAQWWLNWRSSAALQKNKAVFMAFRKNRSVLYIADTEKGEVLEIKSNYAHIQYVTGDGQGNVVMLGRPVDAEPEIALLTIDQIEGELKPQLKILHRPGVTNTSSLEKEDISVAQFMAFEFPPDGRTSYAEFHPPKNSKYDGGLPGEKPPAVVWVHGGPHWCARASLDMVTQFFTTRGWAWIDVNYGGSTSFGKRFRERLDGKWGVLDVDDTCETVIQLDKMGLIDGKRAVVHGSSAGGYTTLAIAVAKPHVFAAGAPWFGISDMKKLDDILHKFEYHLCDRLMGGKYDIIPEVWIERSPIYHGSKIKMPLLIFQGKEDTVIPYKQMVEMVESIKGVGGNADIVLFDGEGHGWRKAETVQSTLEKELEFWEGILSLKGSSAH